MGEVLTTEGTKQLVLTPKDFTSLIIVRLAQKLGAGPNPEAQTEHDFVDGLYARTLYVKKGQVVVGALHSTESFLVLREGHALLADGNRVIEAKAGYQVSLGIGKMCITYAVEDSVFTNYTPNPANIKEQNDLWALNTFGIDDATWAIVDAHIATMIDGIQQQEIA